MAGVGAAGAWRSGVRVAEHDGQVRDKGKAQHFITNTARWVNKPGELFFFFLFLFKAKVKAQDSTTSVGNYQHRAAGAGLAPP